MSGTNIPLYWNPETQQYESVEGEDGAIKVTGADGGGVASEETLAAIKEDTGALAGALTVGVPLEGDLAVGVALRPGGQVVATIDGSQTASAEPPGNATGIITREAGLAQKEAVGEEGFANPVFVKGVAQVAGEVSQGRGAPADTADPWIVASSDGTVAKQVATKEGQDAALIEQQTQTGHLSTIATEVTGVAKDASVQAVELELQDKATEATAQAIEDDVDGLEALGTAGNVNTSAINAKLLDALAVDFATPLRGTATNVATQVSSKSTPRGFTLENIDSANDLYVGTDNTVTVANGFRISPSRSRFYDLGNTNTIWLISATTTAWQIGNTA